MSIASFWSFWPKPILRQNDQEAENNSRGYWSLLLAFGYFLLVSIRFLHNEFWQDELYSLHHFILVPIKTTLTDYHSTNNHILFNFLTNLYLRVIGERDFLYLLNHPVVIRILPFTFTLLSILVFFTLAKRVFGYEFSRIATILYLTSLQLSTFSMQLRGYSLGLLLCSCIILLILHYIQHNDWKLLAYIVILSFLELVNLPSTLYFHLGLMAILLLYILAARKSDGGKRLFAGVPFKLLLALGFGLLLSAVYFLQNYSRIGQNPDMNPVGNTFATLIKQPFSVLYRLTDWRFFVLIPIAISLRLIYTGRVQYRYSLFLLGVMILPFVFFSIHNPLIVPRIWLAILPVFCLWLTDLITPFFKVYGKYYNGFTLLCIVAGLLSQHYLKKSMLENTQTNKISLDLRNQYHLYGFNPGSLLTHVMIGSGTGYKIEVKEGFKAGMEFYMKAYKIDSFNQSKKGENGIILITDTSFSSIHLHEKAKYYFPIQLPGGSFYKGYLIRYAR